MAQLWFGCTSSHEFQLFRKPSSRHWTMYVREIWLASCSLIPDVLLYWASAYGKKKSPPLGLCVGVWTHIFIYFTNEHIWSLLCSAFFTTSRTLPHKQNMQIFNTAHLHLAVPSHNSLQQALQQLHQLSVSLLSLNISHRTSLPHGGPWRLPLESLFHCRSDKQFSAKTAQWRHTGQVEVTWIVSPTSLHYVLTGWSHRHIQGARKMTSTPEGLHKVGVAHFSIIGSAHPKAMFSFHFTCFSKP